MTKQTVKKECKFSAILVNSLPLAPEWQEKDYLALKNTHTHTQAGNKNVYNKNEEHEIGEWGGAEVEESG